MHFDCCAGVEEKLEKDDVFRQNYNEHLVLLKDKLPNSNLRLLAFCGNESQLTSMKLTMFINFWQSPEIFLYEKLMSEEIEKQLASL